ncbi:cytochrome b5-like heme/steroid binding domain-containing protein [Phytohabitans rumicis]|uniref:Membrane protein n=1 Tax=Phytohabitans rumicis TaxID=1076125 RepID=A0A6V8KWY2_9ACTN|nr:cytochrome b5-like heme/steroid binding domain-containing protein [Phytohabitans rumicis]GFJ86921.1 membrane protein [Phytohabitans rumicis]
MSETISPSSARSSPYTGTVLPQGRPFWIVDGRAYDFTEWMSLHPGGAMWFRQTEGRDISALLHTYHRDPARAQKFLAKYEIKELAGMDISPKVIVPPRASDSVPRPADGPRPISENDLLPKLGIPPFLLAPDFDARKDLPKLDYRDQGSLLAEIRTKLNAKFSKRDLKKYDRAFDTVTWIIGAAHVAALALLITRFIPAWLFVVIMVVTRTSLAGAGHYHLHRKWKDQRRRLTMPIGKALFDINYVGTSLIGSDGHVLLHHPYLGSGADVKKTFFDSMLQLHPVLRIPGYTLHKLGICLTGLSFRAREIAKFERPRRNRPDGATLTPDAIRTDFWLIRAWIVVEFVACLATGHIVAWLVQFVITLWFNTFLVVASHDFEESATEQELAAIPEPLRDDWAAQQICLSYDLTVVGNRWIDLFLSAGLSPHRVHHVLPWQGSGFANLASEDTVRQVCAQVGIAWERPRNLIFGRFPAVMKHYLLCPVKPAPPPPPPFLPGQPPPPPPPASLPARPPSSVRHQVGTLVRYSVDGWRGVGV